jgi:hypothetical protein
VSALSRLIVLIFLDKQSIAVRADYDGSYQELQEPCENLMEDLSLERTKVVDGNDSIFISSRYSYAFFLVNGKWTLVCCLFTFSEMRESVAIYHAYIFGS